MLNIRVFAAAIFAVSALSACAPAIQVQESKLTTFNTPQQLVRIFSPAVIRLATGYSRELPAGSTWRPVGVLPQGVVYRPVGSEFTIEGRDVHEAYLWLSSVRLMWRQRGPCSQLHRCVRIDANSRYWPADEVSLRGIAPKLTDKGELLLVLHAFRDCFRTANLSSEVAMPLPLVFLPAMPCDGRMHVCRSTRKVE